MVSICFNKKVDLHETRHVLLYIIDFEWSICSH